MKKVIKSIFIFLLLCIMVNVEALNVGDQFTLTPGASQTHSPSYGFNEQYQLHTVTGGGKTYDAYCMDRGKAAGQGASYVVNRMMPKLKGDLAVLYLMKNGADKEQIHLAIRLLVSKGMLNWSHTGTADYLAKIDAAVNCMKSDSTFNSTLTEFLSNTSKKNSDNDENTDEGGKSLALLGFEKYNLLEGKCKYTTAAQCADATGKGCHLDSNNCYIPSTSSTDNCPTIKDKVFECYTGERFKSTEKFGCKKVDTCSFNTAAECSDNAGLKCKKRDGKWYQLNGAKCEECVPNEAQGIYCGNERSATTGCKIASSCSGEQNDLAYKDCEYKANQKNSQEQYHDWVCTKKSGSICYKLERKGSSGGSSSSCNAKKGEYTLNECNSRVNDGQGTECQKVSLFSKCYKLVTKCIKAKNQYSEKECKTMVNNGKGITCTKIGNNCFQLITSSSKPGDDNSNPGGSGGSGSGSGASVSCGGFDGIKQLLIDAMNYANEKFNSETGESKVEKGPATEPEKADGVIKKIVSVKIDIKNITDTSSDSEYFKYLGFEVEKQNEATEVKLLGASKEFINTEDGWESISEGADLSKLLEERNGTIYVGFLVSRPSSDDSQEATDDDSEEEDCEVKIKFKYEYSNEDGGAVLYAAGNTTGQQRFFIASEGEPIQDEFELDTSLCDETTCDPTSTLPNICEDGLEPDEETGNVEYEFREAYNAESGKYNIKKCLLSKNSKDKAGNEYKLKDDEYAQMVSDNDYCEVKCKEDYIFGVPYKKSTESGRYFQISVSLKGEQDCYTTKLDYKKYTEDIVKKQKEILDTYNEWLENYENYKQYQWTQADPMICSQETCTPSHDKNGTFTGCNSSESGPYDYIYKVIHSNKFKCATITEGDDKWTIDVDECSKDPKEFGKFKNEKTCSASGNSCSTSGECKVEKTAQKDWEDQKGDFEGAAQDAKQTLKDKMKELREIIDNYNSCAADHDYPNLQLETDKNMGLGRDGENEVAYWDMVYRYMPSIQYSYKEPEPGISSTKWISSVQGETCEHGMNCDYMYSPDAVVIGDSYAIEAMSTADKCVKVDSLEAIKDTPNLSQKPYCMASDSINDIDDDDHPATWYCDGTITNDYEECVGDNSLQYESEFQWTVLDEDLDKGIEETVTIGNNLSNSEHKITKVDYVHKIASSGGTYKTERVYYSGHDDGDIKIEKTPEHEIKNYDIVDGLPVGINTPTGTYYYKLTLNNFGTFYSNVNENGRIYGTLDRSLSSQIRGEEQTKGGELNTSETIGKNEYACTYEVNQNSCTDASGNKHYKTECDPNEDWDKCQERLCPVNQGGPYCVEKSQSYYVCSTTHYDESCQQKGSREEALLAVGCQPGEECENNYNCCPNCTVQCIGVCTVTPDGSQGGGSKPNYDFRPISPGNLFPNDRPKGYNWESDPSVYNNSLVARKAKDTIDEITARAKDTTSEETTPSSGNPKVENYSLKVVMDTDMITKIREYNKSQESYNNDTMTCYDYQIERDEDHCKTDGYTWKKEGESGKCVMANIFCYSSFVDDLADGKFGGEVDIKNKAGRTKAKEQFSKTYVAPGVSNTDNLIVTNDYWTIYTFSTLDINGDGIPDVGPSWK
ncbi:unknown [Mycoplasma sp. CAG:472]|nr:unknown [Mycoplasma sp. CAG:472]